MARMGNSRSPLRDSKLTRIQSGSVRQGEGVEMAMDALRESDKRELSTLVDTFARESTESDEHVKQEMAVMRDDLELLRHAVQARKAGKLEVSELAEARQAANDCSGWLQRLGGLLGSSVGGQTGCTHRDSNNLAGFSEATKEALRVLQQEMVVLHRTFQAAYPGRKGFAMSGTPRASEMAAAQPARCSTFGQTPRTREPFMLGAGTGDGTDRAVHGSTLSDFFGVTSTGATTQSSQQLRARSATPTALEQELTRREDVSTARGEIDGQSPPHNSPRGNDSPSSPPALKPSGGRARRAQAPAGRWHPRRLERAQDQHQPHDRAVAALGARRGHPHDDVAAREARLGRAARGGPRRGRCGRLQPDVHAGGGHPADAGRGREGRVVDLDAGERAVSDGPLDAESVREGEVTEHAARAIMSLADCIEHQKQIPMAGAIPAVVQLLQGATPAVQDTAAGILGNLAIQNPANQAAIVAAGALPPLVNLLLKGSSPAKEQACFALWNLACQHPDNQLAIEQAAAIKPLVALLSKGSAALQEEAAGALINLAAHPDNKRAIAGAEAIAPLVEMLKAGGGPAEQAAGCLMNLASNNAENQRLIPKASALPPLLTLLKDKGGSSRRAREYVVGALMNLALKQPATQAEIAKGGAIPLLVEMLGDKEGPMEEVAGALTNLADTNEDNQEAIGKAGAVAPLIKLLGSGVPKSGRGGGGGYADEPGRLRGEQGQDGQRGRPRSAPFARGDALGGHPCGPGGGRGRHHEPGHQRAAQPEACGRRGRGAPPRDAPLLWRHAHRQGAGRCGPRKPRARQRAAAKGHRRRAGMPTTRSRCSRARPPPTPPRTCGAKKLAKKLATPMGKTTGGGPVEASNCLRILLEGDAPLQAELVEEGILPLAAALLKHKASAEAATRLLGVFDECFDGLIAAAKK
jgi:hypothetical protein